jgi:hypothetical protein
MRSTATRRGRHVPVWAALAGGLIVLGIGPLTAGPAAAQPTSNLVFSVDGGTTWSANVNAAPGQTVIAREYYDNDTTGTIDGASVTTSIPSNFSLVAGSTKVCLNPGTTDPTKPTSELACNTDAGQGGAIDESTVWSGNDLAISPTAGIYGQATNQTVGPLAMGKTNYLNFDQCTYTAGADIFTVWVNTSNSGGAFDTGTNVGNSTTALSCGPGSGGNTVAPANSGVTSLDLLANRYANFDQCEYISSTSNYTTLAAATSNAGGAFDTGTDASNTAQTSVTCGPGIAGWPQFPMDEEAMSLNLLDNRYVNLDQCGYNAVTNGLSYTTMAADTTNSGGAFDTGTDASNTAQTSVTCGPGVAGDYVLDAGNSGLAALDTLDATRGQGFVQWSMTAPSPAMTTTYTEDGQLTGPGTGDPSTSGTITINASVGTPLGNPFVIGGVVAGLGIAAAAIVYVRRRTTAC